MPDVIFESTGHALAFAFGSTIQQHDRTLVNQLADGSLRVRRTTLTPEGMRRVMWRSVRERCKAYQERVNG